MPVCLEGMSHVTMTSFAKQRLFGELRKGTGKAVSLPFKLVYHEGYDLNLGEHVFPSVKFRLIRARLVTDGFAQDSDFVEPEPASDDDVLLVHEPGWVSRLKN